jgi:uncharacterized protein YchJ
MKPRVNEPCPCRSGKKYKKCCLRTLGRPMSMPEMIAAGKLPFFAQIINDSDEASSMV